MSDAIIIAVLCWPTCFEQRPLGRLYGKGAFLASLTHMFSIITACHRAGGVFHIGYLGRQRSHENVFSRATPAFQLSTAPSISLLCSLRSQRLHERAEDDLWVMGHSTRADATAGRHPCSHIDPAIAGDVWTCWTGGEAGHQWHGRQHHDGPST